MTLTLPIDAEANDLLRRSPLALLIGMILDQQFPMERAFSAPYELSRRLGHEPTAEELAAFDPDALIEIFARPPVLHRFPRAMAARVQEACQIVVERYDGEVERIWADAADARDAFKRVSALPGFGRQKAQIFLALLGKQFGVRPEGWREVAGDYGREDSFRSVADVVDAASLEKVRGFKKQMKAAGKASG
ncbi:MAG TPA: HhH-GPD-type base excision DNA repair protein [Micromonosporaceae bacterium]